MTTRHEKIIADAQGQLALAQDIVKIADLTKDIAKQENAVVGHKQLLENQALILKTLASIIGSQATMNAKVSAIFDALHGRQE